MYTTFRTTAKLLGRNWPGVLYDGLYGVNVPRYRFGYELSRFSWTVFFGPTMVRGKGFPNEPFFKNNVQPASNRFATLIKKPSPFSPGHKYSETYRIISRNQQPKKYEWGERCLESELGFREKKIPLKGISQ